RFRLELPVDRRSGSHLAHVRRATARDVVGRADIDVPDTRGHPDGGPVASRIGLADNWLRVTIGKRDGDGVHGDALAGVLVGHTPLKPSGASHLGACGDGEKDHEDGRRSTHEISFEKLSSPNARNEFRLPLTRRQAATLPPSSSRAETAKDLSAAERQPTLPYVILS